MSKLSGYCRGLIEAALLATVALIPVFFNRHSEKMFDPDKVALFRSLILLMVAGWLVCTVERFIAHLRTGNSLSVRLPRAPIAISILTLTVAYLVATCFSVDHAISWAGSYDNKQGTYTFLCYVVLFAVVATSLRKVEQIDRFITVMIVAS